MFATPSAFQRAFKKKISSRFGKSIEEASDTDKYLALAYMVRDAINESWVRTNENYAQNEQRQIYYFSLEFLVGQYLENSLIYLGARDVCAEGLTGLGESLDEIIKMEPDPGLGNGGLGRLAACFLDSMASLSLPGHGSGIRYKYGLFQQKIVDGYQVELPDNWLRESNPWEVCKPDRAVTVKFGGDIRVSYDENGDAQFTHENYMPVLAVPYDTPVVGYRNGTVNNLRLWSAAAVDQYFDFASFSRGDYMSAVSQRYSVEAISEVLYPDDSNYRNRQLRLKQQYFFVSAGLQSILRHFKRKSGFDISKLANYIVIHINDTHPALAVPELMRLLLDEEGFGWDQAWDITTHIIAYTNHTIMPEALEKWPVDSFCELLPRIYMIVEEINRRFCSEMMERYPGNQEKINRLAIVADGQVRMANLAVVGSFSVNGVAAVHSELLKNVVMHDLYEVFPAKFNNKTNGITHRRWLLKSNPKLAALISDAIGDRWIGQPLQLEKLRAFQNDSAFTEKLGDIKFANKERLCKYVREQTGTVLNPHSIFDVQVKRIHAYKRQLLNALHIMHLYNRLCVDPDTDLVPRTFLFAGKAAPSYYYAKNVVKLINELANRINNDKRVSDKLRVVFLENYGISLAELIFPASEVSEQISTASKEASGTGNMKFMMNGAITVGTNDGANIEIRERVGDENFFQFGLSVDEVLSFYAHGGYDSQAAAACDPRLGRIMSQLHGELFSSIFPRLPFDEFNNITRSLLDYNDEYFVLKDFDAFVNVQQRVDKAYRDKPLWASMSVANIAASGSFSSDNTIEQYAKELWHIAPVKRRR